MQIIFSTGPAHMPARDRADIAGPAVADAFRQVFAALRGEAFPVGPLPEAAETRADQKSEKAPVAESDRIASPGEADPSDAVTLDPLGDWPPMIESESISESRGESLVLPPEGVVADSETMLPELSPALPVLSQSGAEPVMPGLTGMEMGNDRKIMADPAKPPDAHDSPRSKSRPDGTAPSAWSVHHVMPSVSPDDGLILPPKIPVRPEAAPPPVGQDPAPAATSERFSAPRQEAVPMSSQKVMVQPVSASFETTGAYDRNRSDSQPAGASPRFATIGVDEAEGDRGAHRPVSARPETAGAYDAIPPAVEFADLQPARDARRAPTVASPSVPLLLPLAANGAGSQHVSGETMRTRAESSRQSIALLSAQHMPATPAGSSDRENVIDPGQRMPVMRAGSSLTGPAEPKAVPARLLPLQPEMRQTGPAIPVAAMVPPLQRGLAAEQPQIAASPNAPVEMQITSQEPTLRMAAPPRPASPNPAPLDKNDGASLKPRPVASLPETPDTAGPIIEPQSRSDAQPLAMPVAEAPGAVPDRPPRPHEGGQAAGIARQIALVIDRLSEGVTEIRLDPAELGRLRLTVQATETAVTLTMQAERPETADLMRRHLDGLVTELRALGYADVTIQLDGGRSGPGQEGRGQAPAPVQAAADTPPEPPPEAPRGASGTLDLRL